MTTSRHLRPSRRAMLAAAGGSAAAPFVGPPASARAGGSARLGLDLRWLGTTGWRFEHADQVVLVDPYLSRFPTGLAAGAFDPATPLTLDEAACAVVDRADFLLVTHSHWDHFADVPHLAERHGGRVVGTLTTTLLAQAMGLPAESTAPVKGGEQLDLGDHVVHVLPGLHSRTATWSVLFPGLRTAVPERPRTIADLPEGDTLAFHVRPRSGPSVVVLGASDVDERTLVGVEPDVAAVPVASTDSSFDYLPRLLEGLGRPRVVVPTHWDDFESPLANPPRPASESLARRLAEFTRQVHRVSPRSRVLRPRYLEPLDL